MQTQVTIRMARPADAPALHALEQLDSHRLVGGDVLVAEVDGELRAARSLEGGTPVADHFRPTADLVELLDVHARQMREAVPRPRPLARVLAVAAR